MFADGSGGHPGIPGLGRLRRWGGARLRALLRDPLWRDYEDTLRRLVRGSFGDLTPEQRRERVEHIIGLSAVAAMAMGSAPVPFLELPVQAAMVRAIAKVNGVERPGRKVLLELATALGGGLFFRQVMRMLPLVGPLPHLSRVYGATWALGRTANVFFAREEETPDAGHLRRLFEETAAARTREQSERWDRGEVAERLRRLDDLRTRALITETEYRRKRDALLAAL